MIEQLAWFSLAVLPLVAIPGPDMLLCIAQGLSRGRFGVWRAVNGITLGYLAHALLAAAGLAVLVAASPVLFETVRWVGIAYLGWLALGMLRSAVFPRAGLSLPEARPLSLWRGFLTSFLNPKGLFVYLSVIPQFIDPSRDAGLQALALSVTNAALCYAVYATVGLLAARSGRTGIAASPHRLRIAEGVGGTLLSGVALKLATD